MTRHAIPVRAPGPGWPYSLSHQTSPFARSFLRGTPYPKRSNSAATRREAAERGAGADRDDGAGVVRRLLHQVEGGAPADLAIDPVVLGRDGPFDDEDVLAVVLPHGLLAGLFGQMAGGGEERFVIIERDQIDDQFVESRMARAQQGFRAAGALLEGEPDDGGALALGHGLGERFRRRAGEAHGRRREGTDAEKVPPAHS